MIHTSVTLCSVVADDFVGSLAGWSVPLQVGTFSPAFILDNTICMTSLVSGCLARHKKPWGKFGTTSSVACLPSFTSFLANSIPSSISGSSPATYWTHMKDNGHHICTYGHTHSSTCMCTLHTYTFVHVHTRTRTRTHTHTHTHTHT